MTGPISSFLTRPQMGPSARGLPGLAWQLGCRLVRQGALGALVTSGLAALCTPAHLIGAASLAALALPTPAVAQAVGLDNTVVEAREAARKRDRSRLAAARAALQAGGHPLTPWVEYWDLSARLNEVQADEVEAFYARWSGSYVEDRLRNDWLLELGRRRDWPALARDYPRFRDRKSTRLNSSHPQQSRMPSSA